MITGLPSLGPADAADELAQRWGTRDGRELLRLETRMRELKLEEKARRAARRAVDAEERPPVEWPNALTLRQLLEQPPEPVTWRVEGWLPAGGRVVFAAQAKAGKTTAVVNLVRSLVDGTPWLDRDPVQRLSGRVAVLDFEMTPWQLTDWYRRAGIASDDQVLVVPMRGRAGAFDLREEETRARWVEQLKDNDVELVVWDCLRPVMDALGLDENHDAGLLLTSFDALLTEAGGLEAVVVHHMGHGSERARGDSRIVGWGDANWRLLLGDDSPSSARYLAAYGRDVDQLETQVQLQAETLHLSIVGGTRKAARHSAASGCVLNILRAAEGPVNKRQLEDMAMAQGHARQAVRDAIAVLVAVNNVKVESGPNRALLYALSPQFAGVPECANGSPAHPPGSVPPPIRRHTGTPGEAKEPEEESAAAANPPTTNNQEPIDA